ncbi:hypothetical protein ACIHEJ_27115 [Streptomyces sp. NPDC052301]|uniref:hypothetical protein n=1 Tax=Streptomyces sp. NPDC052301 TaxID=3365687 RepID=UPI0037CDC813
MITFQFTVRPDQGAPHGFDMGDMVVTGDFGTVDSAGHVPDQGMMIYLSVVQLLDDLREFLAGDARVLSYIGSDTSFNLVVRRNKEGMSVAGKNGVIARTTAPELTSTVLHAAEDLGRSLPPEDSVRFDWENAITDFRLLVPDANLTTGRRESKPGTPRHISISRHHGTRVARRGSGS